jgi:uncharacterized LabA/DUF88 family protein
MDDSAPGAETPDHVRVGVFVDWQNCYRTARNAFGFQGPGIPGNVYPLKMAEMLARARPEGSPRGVLAKLRIYTGRASQHHDQRTYAANRRQFQAWTNADPDRVEVVARTLDYKLGYPREKGVDVQLAIDLVRTTLFEEEHDVAVLVSADTDLVPALELLVQRGGSTAVEVAMWEGPYWAPKPLAVKGVGIRQTPLTRAIYDRIADPTDYNVAPEGGPGRRYPAGRRPRP